jgi:hypothetical protein
MLNDSITTTDLGGGFMQSQDKALTAGFQSIKGT